MIGTLNKKTGCYEVDGIVIPRGMDTEDAKEYVQIQKLEAEGGPYIQRWAKETGVDEFDLYKNILENNTLKRIGTVNSYESCKMLYQTLIPIEPEFLGKLIEWLHILDTVGMAAMTPEQQAEFAEVQKGWEKIQEMKEARQKPYHVMCVNRIRDRRGDISEKEWVVMEFTNHNKAKSFCHKLNEKQAFGMETLNAIGRKYYIKDIREA